ncbi:hypothetical protein C7474_2985 [Microbacterium telephonicum]|uniref:Uncharacterized protein n=1 Tax=Microbacterium telephonicum TaxID=1714841 RepID=A0A498BU16_9MICO|nr:hypothetical protein C7474_2985 [Microbacterium telephonicum]
MKSTAVATPTTGVPSDHGVTVTVNVNTGPPEPPPRAAPSWGTLRVLGYVGIGLIMAGFIIGVTLMGGTVSIVPP